MTFLLWLLLRSAQDGLLQRAEKALKENDYPQAVTLLNDYLERQPDDYRALFNLAFAYTLVGDRRRAVETYTRTVALQPQLFEARLNLGILLLEEDRARDALIHLAAAVAARPQSLRASLLYAEALARSGDRAAAVEQYGKALALDLNSAEAHLGLGKVWIEEKRYAQAEQEISRAMELNPKEAGTQLELARVYELAGRSDRAEEVYAQYLKENPGAAPVYRKLGVIYLEQKKHQEAVAAFEQAARLAPAGEDNWNLARAYAGARQPDQALPHLRRLQQTSPATFEALLLLGQMLTLKRDFPAAQGELQAAIRLRPDVPDAYVDLANVMYLQGRYPETIAVLDRLAALGPQTPWSSFLRAIALDKLGQTEPALESYQRFLALDAGKHPDQEFQARQRIKALNLRLEKSGKRRRK